MIDLRKELIGLIEEYTAGLSFALGRAVHAYYLSYSEGMRVIEALSLLGAEIITLIEVGSAEDIERSLREDIAASQEELAARSESLGKEEETNE